MTIETTPSLHKLQHKLQKWCINNFYADTQEIIAQHQFLGVVEEVGELAHAILKQKQQIRINEDHTKLIKDGIADITIYLIGLASALNIDFEKNLFDTAEEVMKRDWNKNKEDGTV